MGEVSGESLRTRTAISTKENTRMIESVETESLGGPLVIFTEEFIEMKSEMGKERWSGLMALNMMESG